MPPTAWPAPAVTPRPKNAGGLAFFVESNGIGADVLELPQSLVHVPVREQPVITAADVTRVRVVQLELGKALQVQLTPSAARELERRSTAEQGRRLVLVINHVPLGVLRLAGPIVDGQVAVFLEVPDAYLPRLLMTLKGEGVPVEEDVR